MKQVQQALANVGIPVYALAWKPSSSQPTTPDKYIVYTTMTLEDDHSDDECVCLKVYVYLNLWSKADPTTDIITIRKAMRDAGFALSSERDSYEEDTEYYEISWTWCIRLEESSS